MAQFKIGVAWQMFGRLVIDADSFEEALNKAQNEPLPEGTYVEDSFEVEQDVELAQKWDETNKKWISV